MESPDQMDAIVKTLQTPVCVVSKCLQFPEDVNPTRVDEVPDKPATTETPGKQFEPAPLPKKPELGGKNCVAPISPEQQLQSIRSSKKPKDQEDEEEDKKIKKAEAQKARSKATAKAKAKARARKPKAKASPKSRCLKNEKPKAEDTLSETKRRKRSKGKNHDQVQTQGEEDITQECKEEEAPATVVKSRKGKKSKKSHPRTLECSKSLRRLKENTRKAKAKAKKTSVAGSSTKDGQDKSVTRRKRGSPKDSPDPSIEATTAAPRKGKGKETQDDKVRERKARISRKSAAYHAAKTKAVREGLDPETATAKAREVAMAKFIYVLFSTYKIQMGLNDLNPKGMGQIHKFL